jgi:cell division septal protein FtsQ
VLRVFEPDRERSIYELNPDTRRMQLRTVEWVRDASVRRAWPNHVMVEITEREPVAFIQVPSGASGDFQNPISYKPMLIDADGVLLPVRGPVPDGLPLLTGVRVSDDVEVRRSLVKQMLHLMAELKEVTRHISEVDVTEPDSLRITYQMPDRPFVLILGNENYRSRLSTFLKNYDGIRHGLPEHAVLDISLEGRVTAVRPDGKSPE